MDNLLSISEAARYLGVSPTTLRRWHDSGDFLATFISPGGHRYYSVADLSKWTKGVFRVAEEWVSTTHPHEPESDFYCSTSDRFKIRHERMAHEFDIRSEWQSFASLIASAAGEIGNNSFDHNLGNWPNINGIFFAVEYDGKNGMAIIADRGLGVLQTLKKAAPELKNDEEAVELAFTKKISSRVLENRGNGLKFVKNNVLDKNLLLKFYSGNAQVSINHNMQIEHTDNRIEGCLVALYF